MFSSLLCICIFYGICFYGILCDSGKDRIISLSKEFTSKQKWIIGLSIVFFLTIVLFWPQQNKYIYFWDYAGYWLKTVNRADYIFNHGFWENIKSLYLSINQDDYNIFLPTILALPMSVIGNSFVQYVVICCIIFLLPTYFVQGMLGTKIINNPNLKKSSAFTISFILAIFFAGNYFAAFKGFVDIAYLLPMSVVIYLLVDYDFSKVNTSKNIAIALNLILIWVCRRYTIYFLIGYIFALSIKALSDFVTHKRIENIVRNFLQIGIVSLGILWIFFNSFILHAITTDYAKIYSGYDAPITQKIACLGLSFGDITGILILIVGIFCFITKKQKENYFALLVMITISVVLFWKIQIMAVHHIMILNVLIYTIILMIFNVWNIKIYNRSIIANSIVILSVLVLIINFSKSFMNDVSFDKENKLFSAKYYPLVRNDIEALNGLAQKLNKLTLETDYNVYIIASGNTLNSSILRNLYAPKSFNAIPNMLRTHDVDLRDGFPTHFLQAKYVVTTSPIQEHMGKGQQIVIRYLAENLQNKESYIGKHYKFLDSVELQNKVVAKIYEKVSEYTEEDLQKIRDYCTNVYPEDKKLFADRIFVKIQ